MIIFWAVTGTLTVVTVALLMLPLLRKNAGGRDTRAAFDITVYKDQLGEVERDLERGLLDATQAESARTEIERRMLAAADSEDPAGETAKSGGSMLTNALIVLVLVAVPLGSYGLYMAVGAPGQEDLPLASRKIQMDEMDRARADMIKMVGQLESRIQADPNDPEAWAYLGQAYQTLGRPDQAVAAFEKLVSLTDRHPEALMLLAEAMFDADNSIVSIPMKAMFEEIRTATPDDPRAYHYLSIERAQHDDLAGALAELIALLEHSPSNAPWVPQVQDRVAAIASELGQSVPAVTMLPSASFAQPGQPAPAAGPGPSPQDMRDAAGMSADEQSALIQSMVDRLAARLADNPDDLEGWKKLARAYQVLSDSAKAAEAQAQIDRLQAK